MKNTGGWCPVSDEFDLQGHIENTIDEIKKIEEESQYLCETPEQRKEVRKAIINYLVERL